MSPEAADPNTRNEARLDELVAEYVGQLQRGEPVDRAAWLSRYPELAVELQAFFDDYDRFARVSEPLPPDAFDSHGLVGTRLGDYEIEEQIARGGMGAIFRARQVSLGRTVAFKLVLGGRLASAEELQRFRGESQATARLEDPGIVKVLDAGEVDGRPYYTMPYFPAGSLAGHIAEYPGDPARAASLVADVARAVHVANEAGVLHRDVKPSNILLDARGKPCLADFGLAKSAVHESDLTGTGAVLGTAEYIAPEMSYGDKRPATRAADIYSLGAVLYQLLTGVPPFRGATPLETLERARRQEPVRPRRLNARVPRDLETVCLKCLEKSPERRYTTAEELVDDLKRFLGHLPVRARPASLPGRLLKWARRHPTIASLCLAVALGVLLITVLVLRHNVGLRTALEDSRRHLYLSTLRLGYEAAGAGRLGELEKMLEATLPSAGEQDLRSFDWYALRRFASARRWSIVHDVPVDRVAFHPTRQVLACGCQDGTIHVWDLEAGKLGARLAAAAQPIQALAFSPDGRLLAVAGRAAAGVAKALPVTVWTWESGEKVLEITGAPAHVLELAFDAGGTRLVLGTSKGVEVRAVSGGAVEFSLAGQDQKVDRVACSRGPRQLVAALASNTAELTLHDLDARTALPAPSLPTGQGRSLAISDDAEWLAIGCDDHQAFLVRAGTSEHFPLEGLQRAVKTLAFSRDGRHLAAGSRPMYGGGQLCLYDVPSGRLDARILAHPEDLASVAFSPSGDLIATCGRHEEVRVWSVEALALRRLFKPGAFGRSAALSPSGDVVAMVDTRRDVFILDPRVGVPSKGWKLGARGDVMAFSPDGAILACGSGRAVGLWSVARRERLASLAGHRGGVRTLAFDPGGRTLAVGSYAEIKVWDVSSGREIASLSPHRYRVYGLAFDAAGRRIISAGPDGLLVSTAVGSWTSTVVAKMPAAVLALAVSPDEEAVALACQDGAVRLVQPATGLVTATMTGHEGIVHGVAFSHDGKLIASSAVDRSLRLWDRRLGHERAILATGDIFVDLAFGPTDEILTGISFGGDVSVMDAPRLVPEPRTLRCDPQQKPTAVGAGVWTQVQSAVLAGPGSAIGAAWADIDGDGDPDVCILRHGPGQLLRNDGAGGFLDITEGAFTTGVRMECAAWGDADGDGYPDLIVGHDRRKGRLYRNEAGKLDENKAQTIGPADAESLAWGDLDGDADLDLLFVSGGGASLLRNEGGGFVDATPPDFTRLAGSRTAVLLDLDHDGDLDVCGGRGRGMPSFYENEGSFGFRRGDMLFGGESRPLTAASWCDWDGDGEMDCLTSVRARSNRTVNLTVEELVLQVNGGKGRFRPAGGRLLEVEDLVNGVTWGDFDLDGDLDCFVARDDGKSMLLRNGQDGLEVNAASGLPEVLGVSVTSASWVDYDGDGDLDLHVTNFDGPNSLFRNETSGGHHLVVELEGRPPNRQAVGATVRVLAGDRWQTRVVGSHEGRLSGHALPVHFGLGEETRVERVEVRWGSGEVKVVPDVTADGVVRISQ